MTAKKKELIELMLDAGFTPEKWYDGYPFAAQDDTKYVYFFSEKPTYLTDDSYWHGGWSDEVKIKSINCLCKNHKRTTITKDQFIAAYNERNKQKELPAESDIDAVAQNGEVEETVINKYRKEIKPDVFVDVYDVLKVWNVTNPALQHLIKKALQPGTRGHKTLEQDIDDIIASAKRAKELL